MSGALTFWHTGGDIIWRGTGRCLPLDNADPDALRDLYQDEVKAAYLAGDHVTAGRATKLWAELTNALDAQANWRRAAGAPFVPMAGVA